MFSSYNPPTISSIYIEGLEISAKDAEAAAIAAKDAAQAARDDALQYRNETHTYYTQVQQIQTGDYVTTQSLNDALSAFSFSDLASVPTSFTPSAHSHTWSEINGKPNLYPPSYHTHLWAHITDKPSEFEPAEHVHTWQQIAQKPGTFPPEAHYHNWADIEGKPSAFNPSAHTHSWGDISGKPTKFEPVVHTHDWGAIDNKPLTFPPQSHTHHWDTVTNKPAQATRWPSFSEVTGKPSSYTPSAHGHAWSEISGKPATATQWPSWAQVSGKPNVVEQSQIGTAASKNASESVLSTDRSLLSRIGDWGLGGPAAPLSSVSGGVDGASKGGMYFGYCGTHPSATEGDNPFPDRGGAFNLIVAGDNFNGGDYTSQIAIENTSGAPSIKVRSVANGSGGFTEWNELLHNNSRAPQEFDGSANDIIAKGFARGESDAYFTFPLNGSYVPSVVIKRGSFTVKTPTGLVRATGIIDFVGQNAGRKEYEIRIPNLTGMQDKEPLYLILETSESGVFFYA